MDQVTIQVLFSLFRSAVRGTRLSEEECKAYSAELLPGLIKLSSKHDLLHLLALGLQKNELDGQQNADVERSVLKAVYRYQQLRYAYETLCTALEKAGIAFLPLKGSVIRQYYPEEWMRTSCDVDILVHEKEVEQARALLVNEYGYTDHGKGGHDVSLFTPNNVHVELHYDLVEERLAHEASVILNNVWHQATVREGHSLWYEMPDELYYFYHVAHMVKHFENGGCGIRPFIDLWILDTMPGANEAKRNALLRECGLLKFADAARRLSRIWMEGAQYDDVSARMEEYLLRGGVYGSGQNRVIVQQQKQGGRFRYLLSKFFLPYDVIKFYYPVLQKHRWLTPIMQVRRWCKLIFCGHLRRAASEIKYNRNVGKDEADGAQQLLREMGLLD